MLHYHVWFDLHPHVAEPHGIGAIQQFLSQLRADQKIAAYRLLKNTATKPDTTLPTYQALIEFHHETDFATTFEDLRHLGIHTGPHGEIINVVASFSADVFKELP